MDTQLKSFQTILLVVFGVFLVVGVLVFSGIFGSSSRGIGSGAGEVVMWGAFPRETVEAVLASAEADIKAQRDIELDIIYVEKSEATFQNELVEALASGVGPDLYLLSDEYILQNRKRVLPIPYESYAFSQFQDDFADHATVFALPEGLIAFPFVVDPMIMYYNKNLLTSAFRVTPPEYWDEFIDLSEDVNQIEPTGEITRSIMALGTSNNINHVYDLVSLMILQTGNQLVNASSEGVFSSVISENTGGAQRPVARAFEYFLSFSDPLKSNYSWNRTLPNNKSAFTAGDVAFYLGRASEFNDLALKNPNLNFGVALVPQVRGGDRVSDGQLYGLAISKISKNTQGAFIVAALLSTAPYGDAVAEPLGMSSSRRSALVEKGGTDFFGDVKVRSSVIAKSWLNPDPQSFRRIIETIINDVASNRVSADEAVRIADTGIEELLQIHQPVEEETLEF